MGVPTPFLLLGKMEKEGAGISPEFVAAATSFATKDSSIPLLPILDFHFLQIPPFLHVSSMTARHWVVFVHYCNLSASSGAEILIC